MWHPEEQKPFVFGLCKLFPKSAVINFPNQNQDDQPTSKKLPPTIMSFYHPCYQKLTHSTLQRESQRMFEKELKVMEAEAKYLMQSQSAIWFEHRKGCLTALRFRAIYDTSIDKPSQWLITQLLQRSPPPKCVALTTDTHVGTVKVYGLSVPHTCTPSFTCYWEA